jgi:hypothetical protein
MVAFAVSLPAVDCWRHRDTLLDGREKPAIQLDRYDVHRTWRRTAQKLVPWIVGGALEDDRYAPCRLMLQDGRLSFPTATVDICSLFCSLTTSSLACGKSLYQHFEQVSVP